MKTIPSVRSTPVTPSMPSIGGPQAKAFTELITEFSPIHRIYPPFPYYETKSAECCCVPVRRAADAYLYLCP